MDRNTDKDWESLSRMDPYWAVLTDPKFKSPNLTDDAREEFFATGSRHIEWLMRLIRERISPGFQPSRALDFGCGVGRNLPGLAHACREVVGADVAQGMLDEARKNCQQRGLSNVRLVQTGGDLSAIDGKFDFIHSVLVFQHIPPRRGLRLMEQLVDMLDAGGVGALHVTFRERTHSLARLTSWVCNHLPLAPNLLNVAMRRPWRSPLMAMYAYDIRDVLEMLHSRRCGKICMELTNHERWEGAIVLFEKGS
jgi:SAM-dependent methyltransferase